MPLITKEVKKQKKLIYLLVIIFIVISAVLVLGFAFFRASPQKEQIESTEQNEPIEKVEEIDFAILENPFLKGLQLFKEIDPFKGEVGRENPFIPY